MVVAMNGSYTPITEDIEVTGWESLYDGKVIGVAKYPNSVDTLLLYTQEAYSSLQCLRIYGTGDGFPEGTAGNYVFD